MVTVFVVNLGLSCVQTQLDTYSTARQILDSVGHLCMWGCAEVLLGQSPSASQELAPYLNGIMRSPAFSRIDSEWWILEIMYQDLVLCSLALQTKWRSAPRGRLYSSFYTVRLEFYYFYLTPASSNLCSTISRKLNSFWALFLCRVRSIYGVGCFVRASVV